MAKSNVNTTIQVDLTINLELSVGESEALLALTHYGSKEFLRVIYEHLGKTPLAPFEKDIVNLFETLGNSLPPDLAKAKKIEETIGEIVGKSNNN